MVRTITLGVRFLCELELVLFGAASRALRSAGYPTLAFVLALLALMTSVLNAMQERSGEPVPGARGVD